MDNRDQRQPPGDGIDRRGMLRCMAWVGTGLVWTLRAGVPSSHLFGREARQAAAGDFSFVQISDSHIGFKKGPYQDVTGTLDTDEKFSRVFADPGTYEYFCAVHPKMTGRVIVK